MAHTSPLLLLPEGATGPLWDSCVRSALEDMPGMDVHRGALPTSFQGVAVEVGAPCLFAPGSLRSLLDVQKSAPAYAWVPVSQADDLRGVLDHISLASHPNNRFAIQDSLASRFQGQSRPVAGTAFCRVRAAVAASLPERQSLSSFVYRFPDPLSPSEELMLFGNPQTPPPALCIWLEDGNDLRLTLENMAYLPGIELLVLSAGGLPPAEILPHVDVWMVDPAVSWNVLRPRLRRWFGDKRVIWLRAGCFLPHTGYMALAQGAPSRGPLLGPGSWNPGAPLGSLPLAWLALDSASDAPVSLPERVEVQCFGACAPRVASAPSAIPSTPAAPAFVQASSPKAAPSGGLLPDEVRPFLFGFERLVVSGKGMTMDLSGNPCPQTGCDAILWKLEPSDLPALSVRLRRLVDSGCRRLVLTYENAFFQTPGAMYAHEGCSPKAVSQELRLAGLRVTHCAPWPGCQSVRFSAEYFSIQANSAGWSAEERLWAEHSRLWLVAETQEMAQVPVAAQGTSAGWKALEQGDLAKARTLFTQALETDQLDAEAYHGLAQVAERQGDYQVAFKNYCRSLECDPASDKVAEETMALLRAHFPVSEYTPVLDYLRKRFPFASAFVIQEQVAQKAPDAASYSAEGARLYNEKRFQEAMLAFSRAWEMEADADTALNYYDCAKAAGCAEMALPMLQSAHQRDTDNLELNAALQALAPQASSEHPLYLQARACLDQGDYNQATLLFTDLLKEQPSHLGALAGVGECAMRRGAFGDARALFAHALKSSPEDQDLLLLYAQASEKMNKGLEARALLQEALKRNPKLDRIAAYLRA